MSGDNLWLVRENISSTTISSSKGMENFSCETEGCLLIRESKN
jgi:hypothetical protein